VILFERLAAELAAADVVRSRSNLDFRVGANVGYNRSETEIANRFPGDQRDKEINAVTDYGLNATLPFASGTTLEFQGGFVRRDTNNPFSAFEFFPDATITVRQALLNGVGLVPNLGNTWIAENAEQIAHWQVEASRNQQAFAVATAYWNLVEAEGELAVFQAQADLARDALDLAQKRVDAEIGTTLDVLEQRTNLENVQVQIIIAEGLVEQRTDELLYVIHPDLLHGYAMFENYRIVFDTMTDAEPQRAGGDEPAQMAEVQAALRRRPEIRMEMKRIENAGISVQLGEYGLLPTLDLEGTFGNSGSGIDFDESWENFFEFKNLNYGFRLNFSVPLQNSAARANMTSAEINKRNAILSARDTETTIILEVVSAVRSLRTARRAIEAATAARGSARARFEAEQEREQAGLSTGFDVKRVRNELATAELQLVKARIGIERARLELQTATGELGR
jgi:outer membrane protein TolC